MFLINKHSAIYNLFFKFIIGKILVFFLLLTVVIPSYEISASKIENIEIKSSEKFYLGSSINFYYIFEDYLAGSSKYKHDLVNERTLSYSDVENSKVFIDRNEYYSGIDFGSHNYFYFGFIVVVYGILLILFILGISFYWILKELIYFWYALSILISISLLSIIDGIIKFPNFDLLRNGNQIIWYIALLLFIWITQVFIQEYLTYRKKKFGIQWATKILAIIISASLGGYYLIFETKYELLEITNILVLSFGFVSTLILSIKGRKPATFLFTGTVFVLAGIIIFKFLSIPGEFSIFMSSFAYHMVALIYFLVSILGLMVRTKFLTLERVKEYEKDFLKENVSLLHDKTSEMNASLLKNITERIEQPLNWLLFSEHELKKNFKVLANENDFKRLHIVGVDLLKLISDSLDYARIINKQMIIEAEKFSLSEILNDISINFKKRCAQKGIDWEFDDKSIPNLIVYADKRMLKRIIKALLSNALKFSNKGPISLHVFHHPGDVFQFVVSDSGNGLQLEDQNIIFKPFKKTSHGMKFRGSGLGLTVAQCLINLMGGEIKLLSAGERGCRFSCKLKLPPAAEKIKIESDAVTNWHYWMPGELMQRIEQAALIGSIGDLNHLIDELKNLKDVNLQNLADTLKKKNQALDMEGLLQVMRSMKNVPYN